MTSTQHDPRRGHLTVYVGPAPGAGTTAAMLADGQRRQHDDERVVVVNDGDVRTAERSPGRVPDNGAIAGPSALDVDALLELEPDVVLVGDLAHTTTVDGELCRRWQDADRILAAGIDVIATLHVQHLESLRDTLTQAAGIDEQDTIPDEFVRAADHVRLVDATAEDIRKQAIERGVTRGHYHRTTTLTVLRELALLWVADHVDDTLDTYRAEHGIGRRTSTRERVVVALTGAPGGSQLIRRAARIARDTRGELIGVHILPTDGDRRPVDGLDEQRRLLEQLDGRYHEILGPDVADSLLGFAHAHGATQLVLGATRRKWWNRLVHGSIVNDVTRRADHIDVHIISTDGEPSPRPRPPRLQHSAPSPRRQLMAWSALVVGYPALTLGLISLRDQIGLSTVLLAYLLLTVAVSAAGGLLPAAVGAITGFLLGNRYFTEPLNTWQIDNLDDIVALFVFLAVALTVATLMRVILSRTADALKARGETDALMRAATALAGEDDPLPLLLEHVRVTFELDAVAVLQRDDDWELEAHAGAPPPHRPDDATHILDVSDTTVLALAGQPLSGQDLETLRAFAANVAVVLERRHYKEGFEQADRLAAANDLRTALLRAVSHDLRTPLSSIKASVTSLLQPDVEWTTDTTREFLTAVNDDTDRLNRLVGNLLDMSRLETGALEPNVRPVGLEDVIAAALKSLGPTSEDVNVAVDETLPEVSADPTLLERAVANLVANARTHGTASRPVHIDAAHIGNRIDLLITDKGPGVHPDDRQRIFEPFQRRGDHDTGENVGLGLAVARGFTEAIGGTINLEDTPGGGVTAVLSLPVHTGPEQDLTE